MDLRWLQDFLSLAEAGNFTSAADSRHSSQPAFSRRIQSLESWLGVDLIDRSRYPTVLTPAGERFRVHAAELVKKMIDSRAEAQGGPSAGDETITFALPHTLATSRFPIWWKEWRDGAGTSSCRLLASNVHDAVTALVSGLADVLICFHHAQQPIYLDQGNHDRLDIGTEWLRPYAATRRGAPIVTLPGTAKTPVPLLSYSSGAFLGRMVELIVQSVPERLHGVTVCESDIANVVFEMAMSGHGIGWLPECLAAPAVGAGRLALAGDNRWGLPLTIFVYRDRSRATPAVNRLMGHLERRARRRDFPKRHSSSQLASGARHPNGGERR